MTKPWQSAAAAAMPMEPTSQNDEAHGTGVALPQGGATAAAVRDGVRQLIDDPSHRGAANRICGEILGVGANTALREAVLLCGQIIDVA